jgi:hypothetical protein
MDLKITWKGKIVPKEQPWWEGHATMVIHQGIPQVEITITGTMPEVPTGRTLQLAAHTLLIPRKETQLHPGYRVPYSKVSNTFGWSQSTRWNSKLEKQIKTWKQIHSPELETLKHVDWWNHIHPEEGPELLQYSSLRQGGGPCLGPVLVQQGHVTITQIEKAVASLQGLPHDLRKDMSQTRRNLDFWNIPVSPKPNWLKVPLGDILLDEEAQIPEMFLWLVNTFERNNKKSGTKKNSRRIRRDKASAQIRQLLYLVTRESTWKNQPAGQEHYLLEVLKETITPDLWAKVSKHLAMTIPSWFQHWGAKPKYHDITSWLSNSDILSIPQEKEAAYKTLQTVEPKIGIANLATVITKEMLPATWLLDKKSLNNVQEALDRWGISFATLGKSPEVFHTIIQQKHPLAIKVKNYIAEQI